MASPDPATDANPSPVDELTAVVDAWNDFFASVRRAKGRAARQHGTELTLPQFGRVAGAVLTGRALARGTDAKKSFQASTTAVSSSTGG